MKKRVLSAILWAYATWYACNVLGAFAGAALPGAVIGLAVFAFVLAMPMLRAPRDVQAPLAAPTRVPSEG